MGILLATSSLAQGAVARAAVCPREKIVQGQWIAALCAQAGEPSTRAPLAKPGEKQDFDELEFAGQCVQPNVIKRRFDACLKAEICAKNAEDCYAKHGQFKLLTLMNHNPPTGLTQRRFQVCLPKSIDVETVDQCLSKLTRQLYLEVLRPPKQPPVKPAPTAPASR